MCEECNAAGQGSDETVEAAKAAVLRGAAHFDEIAPSNWRELIVLPLLDINDPCFCVAGQVFGIPADEEGRSGYAYWVDNFGDGYGSLSRLGLCPGDSGDGVWVGSFTLTKAWKDYLRASSEATS